MYENKQHAKKLKSLQARQKMEKYYIMHLKMDINILRIKKKEHK